MTDYPKKYSMSKEILWFTEVPPDVISEIEIGEFRFCIVGFGVKRASQFKAHNLIWRKHPQRQRTAVSRMDYHPKHEPCIYNQTTLWEIGRENDKIHPTQKPIEVFEIPMKNNTNIGDVCIEPFAGSGSQIIAAHNLSRRCFAMEISPSYGAVVLQRFQDATGITPILVDTISVDNG